MTSPLCVNWCNFVQSTNNNHHQPQGLGPFDSVKFADVIFSSASQLRGFLSASEGQLSHISKIISLDPPVRSSYVYICYTFWIFISDPKLCKPQPIPRIASLLLRNKVQQKGKGKVVPMKTGSGGIVPRILDLGTRWRWVVSFTSRPLYPQGKSPWYPLDRRLGGPQSRSGRGGEEKNSQTPSGIEPLNPDRPAHSLVVIPTDLVIWKQLQV
jgi:hypothetical protein